MGGYPTKYTGIQIDEALEKGRNLRVVNNGWIRLNSTSTTPTDLNSLKNSGNYITSFWTNGPDLGSDSTNPLNIVIVMVNNDRYQFATIANKKYKRSMSSGETSYGPWAIDQTDGAINPGPSAPSSSINGETLWLDTSNPNAPALKIYINNEWKEVIPETAMKESVYDPQGKKSDIFAYIDDAIAAASLNTSGIDFEKHIKDTVIHVTEEDKQRWNSAATQDTVNDAANSLQSTLEAKVAEVVSGDIDKINSLTETANTLKSNIDAHIANKTIHPSSEKQVEWDSKADGDHTHHLDGKVTVDLDHVTGTLSSDLFPYDIKERVYIKNSEEEVYAITKNPVHNGDVICVEGENGNEWYFVVDDSYLGKTNEWTEGTISDTNRDWYSVCYGNDKFVAVASNTNVFAYSTDGITWKEGNLPVNAEWSSICYGNGKFVAVGSSNVFAYSTDGINWTNSVISDTSRSWYSVCYGNGKYVAVASNSIFAYSTDGITWTEGNISSTNLLLKSICYGNGKYVAVAFSSNVFAYSTDGITWTEGNISDTSRSWYSVCYGNGKYVAVTYNSTNVFAYSTDGITWTEITINDTSRSSWSSVCYGNGKFVAVTYNGTNVFAYSTDGINWTEGKINGTTGYCKSVCYGNGKFVAVVDNSRKFAYLSSIPESSKAFKRFSTKPEGIVWDDVTRKPSTIEGYGITDAATASQITEITNEITEIKNSISTKIVDGDKVVSAQTSYNSATANLVAMDNAFASLDEEIAKLETIIS